MIESEPSRETPKPKDEEPAKAKGTTSFMTYFVFIVFVLIIALFIATNVFGLDLKVSFFLPILTCIRMFSARRASQGTLSQQAIPCILNQSTNQDSKMLVSVIVESYRIHTHHTEVMWLEQVINLAIMM
jgi:hypothetical protein